MADKSDTPESLTPRVDEVKAAGLCAVAHDGPKRSMSRIAVSGTSCGLTR